MNAPPDEPRAFGPFPIEIWFHIKHMLWGPEYWKKCFDLVVTEVSNICVFYSIDVPVGQPWRRLAFSRACSGRHLVTTSSSCASRSAPTLGFVGGGGGPGGAPPWRIDLQKLAVEPAL